MRETVALRITGINHALGSTGQQRLVHGELELVLQLQPPGVVGLGVGQGAEQAGAGAQRGVLIEDIGDIEAVPVVLVADQRSQPSPKV